MNKEHLKYRMIYGEQSVFHWGGIKFDQTPSEFNGVIANSKYVAYPWQATGGGSVCVLDITKPKNIDITIPKIIGHKGQVQDMDFNPFDDATSSVDTKVRVWRIPQPFDKDVIDPLVYLSGHQKKVYSCKFNPIASGILASAGQDSMIKIWNLMNGEQAYSQNVGEEASLPYSLQWNYNGSLLASIWKDKNIRITDQRQQKVVETFQGHEGQRSQKFSWMGNQDYFCTTGFDKNGKVEVFLWDKRNNQVLQKLKEDNRSQASFPFYDSQLNILYTAAKGDGSQRIYEFQNGQLFYISEYRDGSTGKAYGFCNKNVCDTSKTELMRMIKITDTQLHFVSMIQPRRGDAYQSDLYPDCPSKFPALNAEEWLSGKDSLPLLMSMDPENQTQFTIQVQKLEKVEAKIEVEQTLPNLEQKAQQIKEVVQDSQNKQQVDDLSKQIEALKASITQKDQMIKDLQKKVDDQKLIIQGK